MSDEQAAPETTDLGVIPISEIKPEDVGTLTLTYTDGVPGLTLSGGTVVPADLTVSDESGNPVAVYTAAPIASVNIAEVSARRHAYDYGVIHLNADPLFEAEPGEAGGSLGG
ncbi:hypothetical protein KO481_23165 [Nocardia sp. NEAU-G5]|uniref:Ig-like domain-containing protein n=1 Tax=Nocardia albiluteola TaxID=2842303 RepID=A0ABS6B4T0_9NOCA|nr:hypothetical protein [Nocardia albiluteola]MBU3064421.1 hypothetical protein [Nocardia albiluteola]